MTTAAPHFSHDHRPCLKAAAGYVSAERGYRTAAAAARAIPILNRARRRFGKAPYTHIASFGEDAACVSIQHIHLQEAS